MTLAERLKQAQAEILRARSMMEQRILAAIEDFEREAQLSVDRINVHKGHRVEGGTYVIEVKADVKL